MYHVCVTAPWRPACSYKVGESFVHMSEEATQEVLEEAKARLQEELTKLKTKAEEVDGVMTQLKAQLYTKFGENINLEY